MVASLFLIVPFQLGWGTANNTSNNDTCLKAVAQKIDPKELRWNPIQCRVWCVTLTSIFENSLKR